MPSLRLCAATEPPPGATTRCLTAALFALTVGAGGTRLVAQDSVAAAARYGPAIGLIDDVIRAEMADKRLPALFVALVDPSGAVWARGYGVGDPATGRAATASTVVRVGAVSKLFTALAVMRQWERGHLDLDASVQRYIPEFEPHNPFSRPITLRQLLADRAGLVREAPVGHYSDTVPVPISTVVASLNETTLAYAPGARPKESNAGVTVAGLVVERQAAMPFAEWMQQDVFGPLGMGASAFTRAGVRGRDIAVGESWSLDGRRGRGATFDQGELPAANLYTNVLDLSRVARVLVRGGTLDDGTPFLRPATLAQMWTPQFPDSGVNGGVGIGFVIDRIGGARRVGHDGQVHGFSSALAVLPDDSVAAIVIASADGATVVTTRLAAEAVRLMRAVRSGAALAPAAAPTTMSAERAGGLAGAWSGRSTALLLTAHHDTLAVSGAPFALPQVVRERGDTLFVDSRVGYAPLLVRAGDALRFGRDTLHRAAVGVTAPPDAPARWHDLIGAYGRDDATALLYERDGRLWILIGEFSAYALDERGADTLRFPAFGILDGEAIMIERNGAGHPAALRLSGVRLPRRALGPASGNQLVVAPVRPIDVLLREAMSASPPREPDRAATPDLVELVTLDSTIRLEIRYASTHNLFGTRFYSEARAFLQRPAAQALARVSAGLKKSGVGLLVHDGYRPWYVTRMFWDAAAPSVRPFVANPATGSRHNRGAAVDLSLYDLATGAPVEMVSTYDETTERAFPDYPGGTTRQRWYRDLLRRAMDAEGFSVNEIEWWHYDYAGWERYPIGNAPFERLGAAGRR